jgi:uracil-DNA glycosylase family 4
MPVSGSILRAYLEAQSELGVDEVILPYPLQRKLEATNLQVAPASPAIALETLSPGGPRESGIGAAQEVSPRLADPAVEGLFASLEKSLADSAAAKRDEVPLRARPESVSLPVFPDLQAFWSHLEANPALAAGDSAAAVTRVVRGHGPAGVQLALAGLEPGEADAAAGLAFQGESGALLAKMLKAIRLDAAACYRTNLVKAVRPTRATRRDLARLLPWLHAELALVRTPFVLLLGEAIAQAVLKTGKPLDELRQEPFRLEGREFAVTYHPADLLSREELKRKAWEDLQWLQKRMAEGA